MPSRYDLSHLDISARATPHTYKGSSSGRDNTVRIREEHGRRLANELAVALAHIDETRPTDARLDPPTGGFIEVELHAGASVDVLEYKQQKIRPGAVTANDRNERNVALFVPDHARAALQQILEDYRTGPLTEDAGNPPNKGRVGPIDAIRVARLETFWTGPKGQIPTDPHEQIWWGVWCWRDREAEFETVCVRFNLRVASTDRRLYFPEIVVIPVFAPRVAIELILFATGAIAELRRADDTPTFFTDDIRGKQHEWTDDLSARTVWPASDAPAVCVFDTGVNRAHSLIEPALAPADLYALRDEWGTDDHHDEGHGTAMAGMALHGDLTAALSDASQRELHHRLESVKVLPPDAFDPNEPRSYGILTQAAVALPEFRAPERPRVFCMAVSNLDVSGATPSSWSAAIDQAAMGKMVGDDDDAPRRLIVVAAGNIAAAVNPAQLKDQSLYPIEDPAQAWNALTVGGYTDLNVVRDQDYDDWKPLAEAGDLSPHSRTSVSWPQGRTPFKPEVVLEAGNRAVNPAGTEVLTFGSLSLLATGRDTENLPLVPFQATSAAAAQGARLAARLMADHPDYWPETVRGLIVHSAEWTEPMLAAFGQAPGKKEHYELVRRFGYGVPDYDRATASARNHLAIVAQAWIQPFELDGNRRFHDCHYYTLPLPARQLEELENEIVELKITLSYFIEPNPGLSASVDPQRYQSHGLRFELRRKGETADAFKKGINAAELLANQKAPRRVSDDDRWMLGPNSVSAGSLHCDVWIGPAIDLLGRDTICVFPVNGWWRNRASKDICNRPTRYSLVVTLKARNVDIDLYTAIKAIIDTPLPVPTDIEISRP